MGTRQSIPQRVEMFGFEKRGNLMVLTGQEDQDLYERQGITYHFTQEQEEYPSFAVLAGVILLHVPVNDPSVVSWLARSSRVKAQLILVCEDKKWLKGYITDNVSLFQKPTKEPLLLTPGQVDIKTVCHFLE